MKKKWIIVVAIIIIGVSFAYIYRLRNATDPCPEDMMELTSECNEWLNNSN
ncbi:MAG: hypothetical protein WCT44_02565 [Candidatus Paceibacterota bacterium]